MLDVYILGGLLLFLIVSIPIYFVGAALYKRKQDEENANKKKVYISEIVLTYCGVGTELMNTKRIYYENYTEEEAKVSYAKLQAIIEKTHQKLDTLSDTDIFNFQNIIVIHKNQLIAIELGKYTQYE